MAQTKGSRFLDALFHTGYPHAINGFVALMLALLPVATPLSAAAPGEARSELNYGVAGLIALIYLFTWSRLRVYNPQRSTRFLQGYLIIQTVFVSLIYVLDGGLTRFLFFVVAVQAVYVSPVRRWAPFLGTVGALWLILYLVISPHDPGASKVAIIGMYLGYLIFAAVVTFTTVQQERQVQVAHELLAGVDERHQTLREYDLTVESLSEVEERERLARTIFADLLARLESVRAHLFRLLDAEVVLNRPNARTARLKAKDVLTTVREAVRTLRPGEPSADDADEELNAPPTMATGDVVMDPISMYHVWNLAIIVVTTGVMVASALVGGVARWAPLLGAGLGLLAAYGGTVVVVWPRWRTLLLVVQAGLIVWLVRLSGEPLMSHLFMIVAAQSVFLVPLMNRWLVASFVFPILLVAVALWTTGLFIGQITYFISLVAAFGVMYFFSGVMAFMTRRQVEARHQATLYAQQMAQVNHLLEVRLQQVRRMAIARERIRMAREIHDSLGHHLTTAIVELQYVEELADEEPDTARQHIRSAIGIVNSAINAGLGMGAALERFDHPLPEALAKLVAAWRAGSGATVDLKVSGDFSPLTTDARITLYRAVQESLTNIQKHARARHVEILLRRERDHVLLVITNDDTGPAIAADVGGFGLVGLRERADALQGVFTAGVHPGGGFEVKLVLPLEA